MQKKNYLWELIFTIGIGALAVVVQRKMSTPDFGRTIHMRSAMGIKRFAQGQADMWQQVAGNAANTYNSLKL